MFKTIWLISPNLFAFISISGCCIYKKPLEFGESSSDDDDDECDHCFGHVEKKKKNRRKNGDSDGVGGEDAGEHSHDAGDSNGKEPSPSWSTHNSWKDKKLNSINILISIIHTFLG